MEPAAAAAKTAESAKCAAAPAAPHSVIAAKAAQPSAGPPAIAQAKISVPAVHAVKGAAAISGCRAGEVVTAIACAGTAKSAALPVQTPAVKAAILKIRGYL